MRRLALVMVLVGLVSFGCAEDDSTIEASPDASPSESEPMTSPQGTAGINDHGTETFTTEEFEAEVELDDFYFAPTFIKSPGAATAMLTLSNEGDATHTFTSDELDIDEELEPGASREVEVEIGTETRYEYYCRFHEAQGMRGAFQPH